MLGLEGRERGLEKRERLLNKKYELQRRERESSFYRQAPHFHCTLHVPTHNIMAHAFQHDISGWNFKVVRYEMAYRIFIGRSFFVSRKAVITTQYSISIGIQNVGVGIFGLVLTYSGPLKAGH